MNILELNKLIKCIENENKPKENWEILSYYYRKQKELKRIISRELIKKFNNLGVK